jgi:hypothetical protein
VELSDNSRINNDCSVRFIQPDRLLLQSPHSHLFPSAPILVLHNSSLFATHSNLSPHHIQVRLVRSHLYCVFMT